MKVGWLCDIPEYPGGAELTQAEFLVAAPDDIQIVDCPPGQVDPACDRYVIQNCVTYRLGDLETLHAPVFKYWHDVGPWIQPDVRAWLDDRTQPICCSPIQADYMGLEAHLIPPAVDLTRFQVAGDCSNGNRRGAVSVGSWRNYGKAPHKVLEWAQDRGGVDFYGSGPMAPPGSREIAYDAMPSLLAGYETFVFLPSVIEPFGRSVAEAWAAGCQIVTNRLVGAGYWLQENPDAIDTAAQDFWRIVTE